MMNLKYGGRVPALRKTKITEGCLGPFTHSKSLTLGAEQSMMFLDMDDGPFYLSNAEQQAQKNAYMTGRKKPRKRRKAELIQMLNEKNISTLGTYKSAQEIQRLAIENGIELEEEIDETTQGWLNQPKGLLQVLWERGWINPDVPLSDYIKDKRESWLDDKGQLLPAFKDDFQKFSLTYLLSECPDFKHEKSALEQLATDLSSLGELRIEILLSPKYHCELAGEGIEYAWGLSKKIYRKIPYAEKKGKDKFHACVKKALGSVSIHHLRKFSAWACCYMLTYLLLDSSADGKDSNGQGLPFKDIELFVDHKMKVHRSC